MKTLLCVAFALTFIGASCQSVNPLTRSCPGSTVQSVQYLVQGNCGGVGVITVSASMAGQCTLAVLESTSVGLPEEGTFSEAASQTNYQLVKGNWNLQNPPQGQNECNGGLSCNGGTAAADGSVNLTCIITECEMLGDDQEATAVNAGTCTAHLTVFTGDAGVYNNPPDATAPTSDAAADGGDAGAVRDATTGQ